MSYDKFSSSHRYFLISVTVHTESIRYSDVMTHPKWHLAMKQEIDALEENSIWEMASLPPEK